MIYYFLVIFMGINFDKLLEDVLEIKKENFEFLKEVNKSLLENSEFRK